MSGHMDANEILQRSSRGITLLIGRQAIIQLITFAGGIVLARVLNPADFGIFAIVSFIIGVLTYVGDLGVGASLIQRKEELTDKDLQAAFTFQLALLLLAISFIFIVSPAICDFYPQMPGEAIWFIRILSFSLLLASWRSISVVQMERRLIYDRLAVIESVEALLFQATVVTLAVLGFGAWSFIWAVLLRTAAGVILAYIFAPWPVGLNFNFSTIKHLLRFGVPFQYQSIINQLTSAVIPGLAGALAGPQAVGYLTWARVQASKPLMVVDNVARVSFPMFSRLQDDANEFLKTLTFYTTSVNLFNFFWVALIASVGHELVVLIYGAKWINAVACLVIFSLAVPFHSLTWLVGMALNGRGQIGLVNWFITLRAVGLWSLSVFFLPKYGYVGVAAADLIINCIMAFFLLARGGPGLLKLITGSWWIALGSALASLAGQLVKRGIYYYWGSGAIVTATVSALLAVVAVYAAAMGLMLPRSVKCTLIRICNNIIERGRKMWQKQ